IVMEAAAQHLASVTLELGGKCPAIVDRSANIQATAQRIVQTKWANAGQTCIAPDYILVDASCKDELIQALKKEISAQYPDLDGYPAMVNQHHFERLSGYLEEARSQGVHIICGGNAVPSRRKISPTVLDGTTETLATDEIFGPLLPVIAYASLEEAVAYINDRPRPLGLYIFARDRRLEEQILVQTRSGGTCLNHCALNYYNNNLPFGGVNTSGFGKSHGFEGFKAFSNSRGVYRQVWRRSPVQWLRRPYTRAKQALIDITLKWL
ncbi:MAG: aldehyde dehydrogenase family protein, partial [Saprospiraceae bacterium]|nr:aldehyde dehydrogenase family protein [Saprospiraceae bacterium]